MWAWPEWDVQIFLKVEFFRTCHAKCDKICGHRFKNRQTMLTMTIRWTSFPIFKQNIIFSEIWILKISGNKNLLFTKNLKFPDFQILANDVKINKSVKNEKTRWKQYIFWKIKTRNNRNDFFCCETNLIFYVCLQTKTLNLIDFLIAFLTI